MLVEIYGLSAVYANVADDDDDDGDHIDLWQCNYGPDTIYKQQGGMEVHGCQYSDTGHLKKNYNYYYSL